MNAITMKLLAERAIAGEPLAREEARALLDSSDDNLLTLLDAAFSVRRHFHGKRVRIHVLENAKSGACPEDCGFCSQSSHYETPAEVYPMESVEQIVEGARRAKAAHAWKYCIVTATTAPSRRDLEVICEATRRIKAELDLTVCASLGALTEAKAAELAAAGVDRFNHNLETGPEHFAKIVSTHTFADRQATARMAKQAGMDICSGGIIGMGESKDDVVDLLLALREIDADSVPVNFLDPRPGTPLSKLGIIRRPLDPRYCLKVLAVTRLMFPSQDVRVAGGREVNLRSLTPLALYAVNSIFTNGYLTTPGSQASADHQMILDAGFEIEEVAPGTHLHERPSARSPSVTTTAP